MAISKAGQNFLILFRPFDYGNGCESLELIEKLFTQVNSHFFLVYLRNRDRKVQKNVYFLN